jgi:hypothetical protein
MDLSAAVVPSMRTPRTSSGAFARSPTPPPYMRCVAGTEVWISRERGRRRTLPIRTTKTTRIRYVFRDFVFTIDYLLHRCTRCFSTVRGFVRSTCKTTISRVRLTHTIPKLLQWAEAESEHTSDQTTLGAGADETEPEETTRQAGRGGWDGDRARHRSGDGHGRGLE